MERQAKVFVKSNRRGQVAVLLIGGAFHTPAYQVCFADRCRKLSESTILEMILSPSLTAAGRKGRAFSSTPM